MLQLDIFLNSIPNVDIQKTDMTRNGTETFSQCANHTFFGGRQILHLFLLFQTLHKSINRHKFDIRTQNKDKMIGEHFNFTGHSVTAFKVVYVSHYIMLA